MALRALDVCEDRLGPDVVAALGNEAWRVREMAAKVVRLRELPGPETLLGLVGDEVSPALARMESRLDRRLLG